MHSPGLDGDFPGGFQGDHPLEIGEVASKKLMIEP
jgi:hypothetical protein